MDSNSTFARAFGATEVVHETAQAPVTGRHILGRPTFEGAYLAGLPLYQRNVRTTLKLTPASMSPAPGYSGNASKSAIFRRTFTVASKDGGMEEVKTLSSTLHGNSAGGAMTSVQRNVTDAPHAEVSNWGGMH